MTVKTLKKEDGFICGGKDVTYKALKKRAEELKKKLPKLIEVDWENGDKTQEIPIREESIPKIGDIYYLDISVNGNYWAYKLMCTIIEE
jgi:hypothetical protein